jgi:hypothetical protein
LRMRTSWSSSIIAIAPSKLLTNLEVISLMPSSSRRRRLITAVAGTGFSEPNSAVSYFARPHGKSTRLFSTTRSSREMHWTEDRLIAELLVNNPLKESGNPARGRCTHRPHSKQSEGKAEAAHSREG